MRPRRDRYALDWSGLLGFTMTFRKILCTVLSVGLLFTALSTHKVKPQPVTFQQRTQHMVEFLSNAFLPGGQCTATAIGPHAILTASHCNESDEPLSILTLDYSTRRYNIVASKEDSHDHTIYLIDGPPLRNYLPQSALLNTKPTRVGETVCVYGDGEGTFPPRRLCGGLAVLQQIEDFSDVDQDQGIQYYTLGILHGDSGSAIFGEDGRVVGLVTYGFGLDKRGEPAESAAGFPLTFSEQDLQVAATFDIEKLVKN